MKFWENNCNLPEKPEAVVRASAEYRSAEDWVANFVGECCTEGDPNNEECFVRHNDLYRVYHHWAKNNGEYIRSSNAFGKALLTHGWRSKQKWYDTERKSTTKIWYGYELLEGGQKFHLIQGEGKKAK